MRWMSHGEITQVLDGSPCWFHGSPLYDRSGTTCVAGRCLLAETLLTQKLCGNGLLDYSETCDCGPAGDNADSSSGTGCCDCSTCLLKTTLVLTRPLKLTGGCSRAF